MTAEGAAMAIVSKPTEILELHNGDRMTREEFHRIYEQMPENFRAELIGGIVYVNSPLRLTHGMNHLPLGSVFLLYESRTPGVQSGDNATILLGDEGEPQPDLFLRIHPEYGGQSRTTDDDYVEGAPELVAEIAYSSRAIDLHAKYQDYAQSGVREYLVLSLREDKLYWFDLQADQELQPGSDGVIRIRTFPGLWIHVPALIARDPARLIKTLDDGLNAPEHQAFIQKLESQRRSS